MTIPLHKPRRWYVFRAGAPGHYTLGWHATTYDGMKGAWFPTWVEALDFARAQVAKQRPASVQVYSYAQALADGIVR